MSLKNYENDITFPLFGYNIQTKFLMMLSIRRAIIMLFHRCNENWFMMMMMMMMMIIFVCFIHNNSCHALSFIRTTSVFQHKNLSSPKTTLFKRPNRNRYYKSIFNHIRNEKSNACNNNHISRSNSNPLLAIITADDEKEGVLSSSEIGADDHDTSSSNKTWVPNDRENMGLYYWNQNFTSLPVNEDVNPILSQLLFQQENSPSSTDDLIINSQIIGNSNDKFVYMEGYISKRRAIGKSLCFLDVIPCNVNNKSDSTSEKKSSNRNIESDDIVLPPVQALLKRDNWQSTKQQRNFIDTSVDDFDAYYKAIQPGVYVNIYGKVRSTQQARQSTNVTNDNNIAPIIAIQRAQIALINSNPQHIRNIIKFYKTFKLSKSDLYQALFSHTYSDNKNDKSNCCKFDALFQRIENCNTDFQLEVLAKEILQTYNDNHQKYKNNPKQYQRYRLPLLDPSKLMGSNPSQKVSLLPMPPDQYANPPSSFIRNNTYPVDAKIMNITGFIQKRRRFDNSITVFELVPNENADPQTKGSSFTTTTTTTTTTSNISLISVLHPQVLTVKKSEENNSTLHMMLLNDYGHILCPDTKVTLTGIMTSNRLHSNHNHDNDSLFWIQSIKLERSSWRPSVIEHVLKMLQDGNLSIPDVTRALQLSSEEQEQMFHTNDKRNMSATQRQWYSKQISQKIQKDGRNSRIGEISTQMMKTLKNFQFMRQKYPIQQVMVDTNNANLNNKSHQNKNKIRNPHAKFVDSQMAADTTSILASSGSYEKANADGSRYKRAKQPQLIWMIHQIKQVIETHPKVLMGQPLKIVDIGGGKGHLSNLVAEYFGPEIVQVRVIDISFGAIRNGEMRAKRRMLSNIHYKVQDATTLVPKDDEVANSNEPSSLLFGQKKDGESDVDMVIGLHACGTLTDIALSYATCHRAAFVICPCCYLSNQHLPMIGRHKTAIEWLGLSSKKNIAEYQTLLRLAELQGDLHTSSQASHSINAIRASAVQNYYDRDTNSSNNNLTISIKTMPIEYSTRNFCLVGKLTRNQQSQE